MESPCSILLGDASNTVFCVYNSVITITTQVDKIIVRKTATPLMGLIVGKRDLDNI
jgi:hypothetical protein